MAWVEKNLEPVKNAVKSNVEQAQAKRDLMTAWISGLLKVQQEGAGEPTLLQLIGMIPIPGFNEISELAAGLTETSEEAEVREFKQNLGAALQPFRSHYCKDDPTQAKVNSYLNNSPAWGRMLDMANEVNGKFGYPQMTYP